MKITEIKRHLNKPAESYLCDLFRRGEDYLVLRYINDKPGRVGDIYIEAGSTTHAYYKTGMGYVLWRMSGPDERLKGYLFHICKDQRIEEKKVEYLDLLLDVWIDPDGQMTILDRDEVEACAAKGLLGEKELSWIARHERKITKNWRTIIADFELLQAENP